MRYNDDSMKLYFLQEVFPFFVLFYFILFHILFFINKNVLYTIAALSYFVFLYYFFVETLSTEIIFGFCSVLIDDS